MVRSAYARAHTRRQGKGKGEEEGEGHRKTDTASYNMLSGTHAHYMQSLRLKLRISSSNTHVGMHLNVITYIIPVTKPRWDSVALFLLHRTAAEHCHRACGREAASYTVCSLHDS